MDSLRNGEEGASALHEKSKKTMRWYLLITKKFFFWIFWRWKIWYFWAKTLIKIWYLLITEKFWFSPFRELEIQFFLSQKVDGKMIFAGYWEVIVLNFLVMVNTVFFSPKKLMKRWYLLGIFELSMIFQDLGYMVFCAVWETWKHWSK